MDILKQLADEFNIRSNQVNNTVKLIDEGNTIPFISRYRKEMTGGLDDQLLRELSERLSYLRNLESRKAEVLQLIESGGNLNEKITADLEKAKTLAEVEDIYRPFKPKRKTRAGVAIEKGLSPLADIILLQKNVSVSDEAIRFVDEEKGVSTSDDAVNGALDIISEIISDDADLRKKLYAEYSGYAFIVSTAVDENADTVYRNYYNYRELASKIPPHRLLALDRGEREQALKVSIEPDEQRVLKYITKAYVKSDNECGRLVRTACEDSYKRLLHPSLERRLRNDLTERSCDSSIHTFSDNLRQLLMQPPVRNSVAIGFDPGYRTGCKVAVVDSTGKVLDTAVVYPTPPKKDIKGAGETIKKLIEKHKVDIIAVGNGTASHESEEFIADVIKSVDRKVSYMVVSEAGASVYSASKLAAEEFPDYDVSLRSAVSIARRLQDPLAELVKIDPKAIGVGQYQHDMPPAKLSAALGGVVEDSVNSVGVDLNTASVSLLGYVSGINASVAKNIVTYREENGAFTDRKELLKVSKLGKKAFEQCAGFMRIHGGKCPLDNTSVHPESYKAAEALLLKCGFSLENISGGIPSIKEKTKEIGIKKLSDELGIGEMTLADIVSELAKPGRDPRDELPPPLLRTDIADINSLKPGMILDGTVRNVIDFGAFVDIGVHQDGLVHISQICDKFIKHPLEAVKVGDIVKVKVLDIDPAKKRISLTMKGI